MSTPAVTAITAGVDGLQDDLLTIAGIGIGIGAVLLAVKKGWSLVRKFF